MAGRARITSRTVRSRSGPVAVAALAVPLAAAGLAVGGASPALAATVSPSCSGGTCTVSFTTPGTGQSFTVPAGVTSLSVTLYGGQGGNAGLPGDGGGVGDGAEVTAILAVGPGSTLGVDIGGAGRASRGGVNGGGNSLENASGDSGGGGGGATDVTASGTRLLVAGGGGGEGGNGFSTNPCLGNAKSPGGKGGNADTLGENGTSFVSTRLSVTFPGGGGGSPGTTSGPGGGGPVGPQPGANDCGQPESGVSGGNGTGSTGGLGLPGAFEQSPAGGGGGGGYFGGGAGGSGLAEIDFGGNSAFSGGGGGGGGSSYTGGTGVSHAAVNDTGNPGTVNGRNGEAVLSYQQPATSPPPGTGQASTQLAALHQAVHGVGVKNTLAVTVASAQRQLAAGHTRLACRTLTTFITQVRHQTPRFIPASTATHLITDAKTIRALLAC